MRKVKMINRVSIDGYFASNNEMTGGMDWFVPDNSVDQATHNLVKSDTVILGEATFRMFEASWPPVLRDPNAPKEMKALAQELTDMKKIVFSKDLASSEWANTEFHNGDVAKVIKALKAEDGSDILVLGSGTIVQQLANAGLMDEYIFIMTPVIAGAGKPLFKDVAQTNLKLLGTQRFDSGNVLLHYATR